MIKKSALLCAGVAAFALSAPALADNDPHHVEMLIEESETEAASPASSPKMDFGSWGVGLDTIDQGVNPGDDLTSGGVGLLTAENVLQTAVFSDQRLRDFANDSGFRAVARRWLS